MKTIQLHHNGLTTASFLSLQQTCKTWIKQALVSILTAALMLSTTVAVSATSGTLLNWSLNDGSGTIASDSSGLGNNGTVSGGATWVTGKVGGALSFDGASGAVTLASVSGIATGNTPHTVAAWVKVNALPSNRAWILLLGNEGTGAHHWLINSAGGTALGVWSGSQVSPSLPVGQWKHIALTFDGTTLTGYVNGVSIGSQAATFNLAGTPLTLAQAHVGENYFNGVVDELNVYNRALSAAEVATLAGASTNIPPTVSLTAPTNGATYTAPATITLSATAADSDGTIAKVEFYNGTTLLGVASANPPALTLSGVAAGSYTYTAKAYDNLGASTVSAPISISVTNATSSSNIYYIYADHLNTPRVITDTANNVVWKWSSDPFGTDLPQGVTISGAKFNYNLRFPGQYYDQETGLHYNYYRDYDPSTGRYVQSDPIGLDGGINTYSYADSNPIMFFDPTGLLCIYSQSTGQLACTDPRGNLYLSCNGYAGNGPGLNNPNAQNQSNVGPLPRGEYTVGPSTSRRGPVTRRLTPNANNNMEGRAGFLVHGDNRRNDHSASEGCIIAPRRCREAIPTGETVRVVE
jgi:RHS repeat-associated protein